MKIFLPLLFVFTLLSGCNDRPALLSSGFKYIVHTRGKGPKGKANDLALMRIQIRNDTGVLVSRLDLSAIPDTMFTCAKLVKKASNKELAWQKTSSTSYNLNKNNVVRGDIPAAECPFLRITVTPEDEYSSSGATVS